LAEFVAQIQLDLPDVFLSAILLEDNTSIIKNQRVTKLGCTVEHVVHAPGILDASEN
jgi:hypothetical protein